MGLPRRWQFKPHFNFITVHYAYVIGMAIIGSVIIYPYKNMRYIDALFFAAGGATQSGLNTIDANLLKLYQQVVIYFLPMLTTPIFINTLVVFVRLYWFEKRFENIVSLTRQPSRARSALSKGTLDDNVESGREGAGVRGREITVLRAEPGTPLNLSKQSLSPGPGKNAEDRPRSMDSDIAPESVRSQTLQGRSSSDGVHGSDSSGVASSATEGPQTQRQNSEATGIQFVDLPSPPRDGAGCTSAFTSPHIAFAETQRNCVHGKALRIPGPREFEKGYRAQEIDEDDIGTLHRSRTTAEGDRNHDVGSPASRTMSLGNGVNGSNNVRQRKLPPLEQFLPRASTVERVISSAFSVGQHPKRRNTSPFSRLSRKTAKEPPNMPYLSYTPTLGRNSQFVGLSDEERDELGGIEYRSLKLLAKVLVGYYLFFHVFGVVCFTPWIWASGGYMDYVRSVGVNPTWWAIFSAQTAFNDLGFTLTPDSMVSFQSATFVLIIMTFLIIIGNTAFPCMLRLIIWIMFKLCPKESSHRESLNFLLDHPRRCFTLLFPSWPTWMLFWIVIVLNCADIILFIVLDLNDGDVTEIPVGHRIMGAIFQAASTRTAGLAVVNMADLHPAVQVSYMLMMYISVFPIAISVRRTNVYEESSLGIYANTDDEDNGRGASFVGAHLRKQLSFDLWYIFLGLFIITISEGPRIQDPKDYAFTTFAILFEVVSAYGTVGLSLGYPNSNASFSAQFGVIGKLVIIAMQIRGRHRGLPYELDRAILLPSESLQQKEAQDAQLRALRRRGSSFTQVGGRPLTGVRSVQSQAIGDD
ncbi:cation transport protein-domain-containing protein [Tuber indicum]|nr:cation transport protein-domain-containing protein [Tuber indicum]